MNLQNFDKIFIFGKEYNQNQLNSEIIHILLEEADNKSKKSQEIEIDEIIKILNTLSKTWSNPEYHYRKKAIDILKETTSFSYEIINECIDNICNICSFQNLKTKIDQELGTIDVLNDKTDEKNKTDYQLKAVSKGLILHLNYDNLFFEFIDSLIAGIITKNTNIVRLSYENRFFPLLFLESLKEIDPKGLIWNNLAIIFSSENSEETFEELLFNEVSAIVLNGKQKNLIHLKSKLYKDIKVIENLFKYSFAVIENKFLKSIDSYNVLKELASDICYCNQKTSFSPHVVYVIDKELKSSHQLIESLFDEMIQINDDYPIGNLTFGEKTTIRKIREFAKIEQIKGKGRLVCPEDFSFTLLLEYDSKFKPSCLNRTVYIKRVSSIESLISLLAPMEGLFQTAGICVSDELESNLKKGLINLGLKQITAIGGMCKFPVGLPRNGVFMFRELVDWVIEN